MSDPMSDEQLEQIHAYLDWRARVHEALSASDDTEAAKILRFARALLDEVERLRAIEPHTVMRNIETLQLDERLQTVEQQSAVQFQQAMDLLTNAIAEGHRLKAENDAMREIVQAVAKTWYTHSSTLGGTLVQSACCPFPQCEQESVNGSRNIPHTLDCPVTKARALLEQGQSDHTP